MQQDKSAHILSKDLFVQDRLRIHITFRPRPPLVSKTIAFQGVHICNKQYFNKVNKKLKNLTMVALNDLF
jgi:hypothetical protein